MSICDTKVTVFAKRGRGMAGGRELRVAWRATFAALLVFLALDAVNMGLYVAHSLALRDGWDHWLRSTVFDINIEFALGEDIEYLKSLIAAFAMAVCARRSGEMIFSLLSGLNVWLLLDNALTLHETLGVTIAHHLLNDGSLGLARPTDAGELIFFGLFGVTLLVVATLALRRTGEAYWPTAFVLAAATVSPGVTGVFVDGFHALPVARDLSVALLVLIEDGGESAMMSVACALSLGCLVDSRSWLRTAASPQPESA
jgi:hypothetical protein